MTQIEPSDDGFVVDADIQAEAFGIKAPEVRRLMQSGAITTRCETGVDEDEGRWRLVFFHGGRTLRLTVDETGRILGHARFNAPGRRMPQNAR